MTAVAALMDPVVAENVAELERLGTTTDAGTLRTAGLELERATVIGLVALPVSVTSPMPDWPLRIIPGLTETSLRPNPLVMGCWAGGSTVTSNVVPAIK